MSTSDGALLHQFVHERRDEAFAELVGRHVDFVFSAALRQLADDPESARDASQRVFSDLARKAAQLVHHPSLMGWLYTAARQAAANIRRGELRRRTREATAACMAQLVSSASGESEPDWLRIRAELDAALAELSEGEREIVLLRYFGGLSWAEVGGRVALSDTAARLRADRAMGRLRDVLARRGITSSAAALGAVIAKNAVVPAPADLAAEIISVARGAAVFRAGLKATRPVPSLGLSGALFVILTGLLVWRGANQTTVPDATPVIPVTSNNSARQIARLLFPSGRPGTESSRTAHDLSLQVLSEETGAPLAGGLMEVLSLNRKNELSRQSLFTDETGSTRISIPSDARMVEIFTRIDGFADTRLHWQPDQGEAIPKDYVLRVGPGAALGGLILDETDNPIPDAEIVFALREAPQTLRNPADHRFGVITTRTDSNGRWNVQRISPAVLRYAHCEAGHPDFARAGYIDLTASVASAMQAGTHVFRLQQGQTFQGVVQDDAANPVPNAKVRAANRHFVEREVEAQADGSFVLRGCSRNACFLVADAPGFVPTWQSFDVGLEPAAVITIRPGEAIRLHIVNRHGNAITNAYVALRNRPAQPVDADPIATEITQHFRTDAGGFATLTTSQVSMSMVDIRADGYRPTEGLQIQPGVGDLTVSLSDGLLVSGSVRDAVTGDPVADFRARVGFPIQEVGQDGQLFISTNAHFLTLDSGIFRFRGGRFQHEFDAIPLVGERPIGIYLRFEADGYARGEVTAPAI